MRFTVGQILNSSVPREARTAAPLSTQGSATRAPSTLVGLRTGARTTARRAGTSWPSGVCRRRPRTPPWRARRAPPPSRCPYHHLAKYKSTVGQIPMYGGRRPAAAHAPSAARARKGTHPFELGHTSALLSGVPNMHIWNTSESRQPQTCIDGDAPLKYGPVLSGSCTAVAFSIVPFEHPFRHAMKVRRIVSCTRRAVGEQRARTAQTS